MSTKLTGIRIFNTLTRQKEEFTPIEPGKVGMYTCGPTVYDYAHIGNFRAFLFEDLLKRWLKFRGFKITHVMNLTDIDDKTIKGSQKQQTPLKQFTEFYIKAFFEDIATLNIEPANVYPRATQHIPEMVTIIKTLIQQGIAYRGEDGSIYYAISKFPDYGKLSHIKIQKLKAGARVKQDEYAKEEAQDFALWKAYTPEDGDVFWETEFGKGRPGWHIECSAMSMKYLGETFDIHCGGVDNMFPHHENEIAQSEAATGKIFVHYWMHNEHLLVEGKKMAKRLGNFYTLRDLLSKGCDALAIRYLLLSTHYRQQFNFTFEGLTAAKGAIERLSNLQRRLQDQNGTSSQEKILLLMDKAQTCFTAAMDDDLNVSVALASLFDFARDVNNLLDNNALSKEEAAKVHALIVNFDEVLGVISKPTEETLPKVAEELKLKRDAGRKAKDWKMADSLRQQLDALNIKVEDQYAVVNISGSFTIEGSPQGNLPVKVLITGSSGDIAFNTIVSTDISGKYATKFKVSSGSTGGVWTMEATVVPEGAQRASADKTFLVKPEQIRLPPAPPPTPFKLTTESDRNSYQQGEMVSISGILMKNGQPQQEDLVSLEVIDSEGKLEYSTLLVTGTEGKYLTRFKISLASPLGTWIIKAIASSGGSLVTLAESAFTVEPSPNFTTPSQTPTPYKLTIESDSDSYQPGTIATWKREKP